MSRKRLVSWLLLLFTTAAFAQELRDGETEDDVRSILEKKDLTLADLFQLAELRNPTLAAIESSVQSKAGRTRQASLYPNPALEFEIDELSTSESDDRKEKVSIVQPLVLGGRLGAAVEAARAEQEAEVQMLRSVRRDIFRDIHKFWIEQHYFRDANAALSELLLLAEHTLGIAQTRFEARAAPESHVTKALLEVYKLEVAQQKQIQRQAIATEKLSSLLDGIRVPIVHLEDSLDHESFSGSEILSLTLPEDHPTLLAAHWNIEAAKASIREAKAKRIPDMDLFVGYGRHRATDEAFMELGLSVPLPIFNRHQGRVAETQSASTEAQNRVRIVRNDLQVTLETARQGYLTNREQLHRLRDRIGPAAKRGLDQAQEAYQAGHLSFLELIDAQRTHADVRLRSIEFKKDLLVAEAELMSLVGTGPYEEREANPK